jgi:Zn-dependent protease with chaperone function
LSEFSFNQYVAKRESGALGGTDEETRYAFGPDLKMLRGFKNFRPLELVVASLVRGQKHLIQHRYTGRALKVGPRQLPKVHEIAKECAQVLGIAMPALYLTNDPRMNAFTFGTQEDSFIVVHSQLVDHFTDDELRFVIGHEMGHIQNKHVVYLTTMMLLSQLPAILKPLQPVVTAALRTWSRRAELTCDRAGLLCCRDLDVAEKTFVKMASGSTKHYADIDVDAYMDQLAESQKGVGRFTEVFDSHPLLPKRVAALRIFAESAYYRKAMGLGEDGLDIKTVDERTTEIVKIARPAK